MKIGYARVSTITQNIELQIDALKKAGCGKIITEQASGSVANRAELLKAKEHTLRSGDTFVVWRLDRLGRSLKDLISWTEWFAANNIGFESIYEGINTSTSTGKLFVHIFGALSEFEHNLINSPYAKALFCRKIANSFLDAIFAATNNLYLIAK